MQVRCIGNMGVDLGSSPSRYFHTDRTRFHVSLGSLYLVLGMGIWETVLMVLVRNDSGLPSWLPIGLFEMVNFAFPGDWEFALVDGIAASGGDATNRWVAMWGYPELVRDRGHSDALLTRDPTALRTFDRYCDARSITEPQ